MQNRGYILFISFLCFRVVAPSNVIKQPVNSPASHHKVGGFADGLVSEARTDPYQKYTGCHTGDENNGKPNRFIQINFYYHYYYYVTSCGRSLTDCGSHI